MQDLNQFFEGIINNGLNPIQMERLNMIRAKAKGATIVFRVNSDNWTNQLMTAAALKAARLEMSTGDYGTHTAVVAIVHTADAFDAIIDYDWVTHQFLTLD